MNPRRSFPARATNKARGFTLLEVLVSVLLVAIGMLGVSKMQAASMSNTQVARSRALVAFQASSLAALMHGNKAYWGATAVDLTMSGSALGGSSASTLTSSKSCTAAATCTPTELAAFDVGTWINSIARHFPTFTANVRCTPQAVSLEVECLLSVSWAEKYVAVNKSTASAAGAVQSATQLYTLVVRP